MAQSALRGLVSGLMQGGPAPSGMASAQTAIQNAAQRPQPKPMGQQVADVLGGVALPLSAVPFIGDVAGLGADAAMYANYPEERTALNYGLTLAGMLPFVPGAAGIRTAEGALDMSQAARMQRADDMGLDRLMFHGTHAEDITQIDPNKVDIGLHVGTSEQAVNRLRDLSNPLSGSGRFSGFYRGGANVLPLRVQASNPLLMEDVGDWKDSYQVLAGMRGNKAFARQANEIEGMLQEANEIAERYAGGSDLWRDSVENRRLLDEARSMIQDKGYDSVKYLNQVENQYGAQGQLTQAAQDIIRDKASFHDYLENKIRQRMPELPDPKDPLSKQKIDAYLGAKMEDYASPEELQTMSKLREEMASINSSPMSRNDPNSYIILDPANIRSVNAAFDPAKRNSANLMAGAAGAAVGLSALRQLMPQQEQE